MRNRKLFFIFYSLFFVFSLQAYETQRSFRANEVPVELKGIKVDEKPGEFVDLNLSFINEQGQKTPIKEFFNNQPVLFTIIYYNCPNLCQLHLNGLITAISELNMDDDFAFVALSMDHNEKSSLAKAKKQSYIKHFKTVSGDHWHFLTGTEENIKKISQQVGFNFRWNEKEKQFAHLPVAYVLTPQGQISRYLYGVEMSAKTLKLSLVEASQGRIGGVIDRILLFCFQFDPRKNRYTIYAYNIMRIGGIATVILLLIFLVPMWIRLKKETS